MESGLCGLYTFFMVIDILIKNDIHTYVHCTGFTRKLTNFHFFDTIFSYFANLAAIDFLVKDDLTFNLASTNV